MAKTASDIASLSCGRHLLCNVRSWMPQSSLHSRGCTKVALSAVGDSGIIDPRGEYIAGRLYYKEGMLDPDLDITQARAVKAIVDNVAHYSRPDIFELRVNGCTIFSNWTAD
jgi:predicted amidohydrolase